MLLRHSKSPEKLRRHTTLLEDEINSVIIKLKPLNEYVLVHVSLIKVSIQKKRP